MDLLEFCWRAVGKPISREWHSYFKHDHLKFDEMAGRVEFRDEVNRIFREYEGLWLREPKQFLHDALPRAERYLLRFPRPPH